MRVGLCVVYEEWFFLVGFGHGCDGQFLIFLHGLNIFVGGCRVSWERGGLC